MNKFRFCFIFLCMCLILLCFAGWRVGAEEKDQADGKIIEMKQVRILEGITEYKVWYYSDGLKVVGFLYKPQIKKGDKLPVIIFNHDGINGVSDEHKKSSVRLAKEGYIVFSPSYRGEDGSEGTIEIAKGEVKDVLNAIPLVSSLEGADSQNIALVGASHGALISILATGRTDRIKAVVTAYGVMDIYKWWQYLKENNKIGKDEVTKRTYGGGPQDRPQSFKIRNGINAVPNIKCPVLVLQGSKDDIVPDAQAKYLKTEMDKFKKDCTIKIYPDCLHGFLVYVPYLTDQDITQEERDQTEEAWQEMLQFLQKHLKGK